MSLLNSLTYEITVYNLSSQELYSLLLSLIDREPTSQKYFVYLFLNIKLPRKEI